MGTCSPQSIRVEIREELREYLGPDFTAHLDQLKQERDLISEDVYTELKMMNKNELETFKKELTAIKDLNHFEDEEEDEICQLCGAIRLLPRCRKPVDGLPTR